MLPKVVPTETNFVSTLGLAGPQTRTLADPAQAFTYIYTVPFGPSAPLMNFYKSAAQVIDHLDRHQGSVKGSLAAAGIKTANPGETKRVLARQPHLLTRAHPADTK